MQFIDLKTQYRRVQDNIQKGINGVLEHGQYIMGPEVKSLEAKLSDYVGCQYSVACASGTDALLLALMSLDIKAGDEIITSPFSFFASSEVIVLLGAKPVYVDIDPDTYNIDVSLIETAITERTKAIMPISLYGQCSDMEAIQAIADKNKLYVIEDGAQSFGATQNTVRSGNMGTIGCTSFFPSKPLGGYGDSGACFTNNEALATKMSQLLQHGQTARYQHEYVGINGRMDSIQAAILLEKLAIFDEEVKLRQEVAFRYQQLLEGVAKTPTIRSGYTSVFAQYTIEVEDRTAFCKAMQAQDIPTAIHYPALLPFQPALSFLDYKEGDLPVAENASKRVVSLPMHPYLTEAEQTKIVDAVKKAI